MGPSRSYFFYGTLIDPDVREAVLCEFSGASVVTPDSLAGWRAVGVRGRTYPVIVPASGLRVSGVHAVFDDGAAAIVRDRLVAFEGPEYRMTDLVLQSGAAASVFAASPQCTPTDRNWSFRQWERRHKKRFLESIRRGRLV